MWWSPTVSLFACSTATVLAQPHPRLRNHDQRLVLWRYTYTGSSFFLGKVTCLGCGCFELACFFLPSFSSLIKHVHVIILICSYTQPKVYMLDVTREWPPVTSCAFTHNLTSLSYQGPSAATTASSSSTPPAGSGDGSPEVVSQPKGVMLFANMGIPSYVSPFKNCSYSYVIHLCTKYVYTYIRIRNAPTCTLYIVHCTCTCLLEVLLIPSPHLPLLPLLLPLPSLRHSTGRWSWATWERARLTQFTLPWDTRQPQPSRQTANRGPTIQTPSSCAGKFLLHQNFYFFPHKHTCVYTYIVHTCTCTCTHALI